MSASIDYRAELAAHYRAARMRILQAKPVAKPKPRTVTFVRMAKRGPARRIYACPIGPVQSAIQFPPLLPKQNGAALIRGFLERYSLTMADIRYGGRTKKLNAVRQELMWLLRTKAKWSFEKIGEELGGMDHSTILHGVRRHQALIDARGGE